MFNRLRNVALIGVVLMAAAVVVRLRTSGSTASATVPYSLEMAAAAPSSTATPIDPPASSTTINASGTIQANQAVALAFTSVGRVTSLAVDKGAPVLKGQKIAALDTQTALDAVLLAQSKLNSAQIALQRMTEKPRQVDVDVLEAAVALAKAELDEALHSIDATAAQIAQVNVSMAQNALYLQQLARDADQQQKQNLLKNPRTAPMANQLPSDDAENAALNAKAYNVQIAQANATAAANASGNIGGIAAAQAQVTAAQNALANLLKGPDAQDIARAQAGVQGAQAALDQAKSNLDKLTLVAPFDGVIAVLNLHLGQQTPTTSPAAIILDTSSFYVDLPISELDIARVAVGQTVMLTVDALSGQVLTGKVNRIGATGTKIGGVVTYPVHVVIDSTGKRLLAGMTTSAVINVASANS